MKRRVVSISILAAFLSGCIPVSLSPIFTEKDLVADSAIEGAWVDAEAKDAATRGPEDWDFAVCQASSGSAYSVAMRDADTVRHFSGHLTKIGKGLFLDLEPKAEERDRFVYHLIPAHSINRLWIEGKQIRSATLRQNWLEDGLKAKKFALASSKVGDQLVLTGDTAELRAFLAAHADDAGAFDNPGAFRRVGPCPKRPT